MTVPNETSETMMDVGKFENGIKVAITIQIPSVNISNSLALYNTVMPFFNSILAVSFKRNGNDRSPDLNGSI